MIPPNTADVSTSQDSNGYASWQAACVACTEANTTCEVTISRKRPYYYGAEELRAERIRLLESVVGQLFPNVDTGSVDSLRSLLNDREDNDINSDSAFNPAPDPPSTSVAPPSVLTQHLRPPPKLPEGQLIPAPRGGFHYVGTGSSFYFANCVRQLVARSDLVSMASTDAAVFWRGFRAVEFTHFPSSKALEAQIAGHPATSAIDNNAAQAQTSPASVLSPAQKLPGTSTAPAEPHVSVFRQHRLYQMLPVRELSDRLVGAFFSKVHPNFAIFHRGTLLGLYESVWRDPNCAANDAARDPGWACCLMMIIVFGALVEETLDTSQYQLLQRHFLGLVVSEGLPHLLLSASLANVQAMMLCCLYFHNAGERNTAWMILGQASRTAIAMGMHRNVHNTELDPIMRSTRQLVWCTLHSFEQNLCFVLGRPSSTELYDADTIPPDDNIIDGGDVPHAYYDVLATLMKLLSRVKRFVAMMSGHWEDEAFLARHIATATTLLRDLQTWKTQLPPQMAITQASTVMRHRRAIMFMHIQCDHLKSVVGRPFLLGVTAHHLSHDSSSADPLDAKLQGVADQTVLAASAAAQNLIQLGAAQALDGLVWLDMYYVHHAILILALPLLVVNRTQSRLPPTASNDIINLLKQTSNLRMSPTYRILMDIGAQLAYIVGIESAAVGVDAIDAQASSMGSRHTATHEAPTGAQEQNFSVEQLFGMIPSRPNTPPDTFADLLNFGLDASLSDYSSWQFFSAT